MLHHEIRLDERYAHYLEGPSAFPEPIFVSLRTKGAGETCYVFGGELDGEITPLDRALKLMCGMGSGFFVSCVPGRLGFFEYEGPKSSYLLAR